MKLKLFTPLSVGALTLPNRILMAPLTRVRAGAEHVPGDLLVKYYSQRASAGLIFTEATMVAADARAFGEEAGLYSPAHVAGWRRVTDAVHAAGGRIAVQLWHPGRATHPDLNHGAQPVSSSNKPLRHDTISTPAGEQAYPVPRPLRTDEIPGIVGLFRQAAVNAGAAGFDAVQIHGAHGYLLDQFLRDGVNDRTDRYGGSVENRARLLFEVTDAAIGVLGAGRVGVRISPYVAFNDMQDSDVPALVAHVAAGLEKRGAAFLEMRHVQPDLPQELELAHIVRRNYRGALIRNGGFTRDSGEAALQAGTADAVSYGDPFIANPDLPARFAKNAPLNPSDSSTYYGSDEKGYTDYPALSA
jgi:N-ethylmaleimide reductase